MKTIQISPYRIDLFYVKINRSIITEEIIWVLLSYNSSSDVLLRAYFINRNNTSLYRAPPAFVIVNQLSRVMFHNETKRMSLAYWCITWYASFYACANICGRSMEKRERQEARKLSSWELFNLECFMLFILLQH